MTTSENQSPVPSDPQARNRLLCEAARAGDAREVKRLLAMGCDPKGHFDAAAADRFSPDTIPMPQAEQLDSLPDEIAVNVKERMAEFMRQTFAQLSGAPSDHEIPLFEAVVSGSMDCIAALLNAGADPKARDNLGRCALSFAKTPEIAASLVRAGVPLEIEDREAISGSRPRSPLEEAVSCGEEGLVVARALIAAGANVNAKQDHGYTLFMSAVGSSRDPQMLRLLIASGADPHAISDYGYNAWHAAIDVDFEANAEESVRDTFGYLRELGFNIEQRNNSGQTPLARAISDGTGLEVRVLCEMGADPSAVCTLRSCGGDECTSRELPLIFHVVDGHGVHSDVKLQTLLEAGADSHALENGQWTPLCYVVTALAADSDDPDATYQRFFREIESFRVVSPGPGRTRGAFLASIDAAVRECVVKFAETLHPPTGSQFADEWRAEKVNMATLLIADACWKRYVRRDAEKSS